MVSSLSWPGAGGNVPVEQAVPGGLQPVGRHVEEPPGELVAEPRIGVAERAYRRPVELEGLGGLDRHRAEGPPVPWQLPRPAEHVAHPEGLDDDLPLAGNVQVQGHRDGADEPEALGDATVFEDPLARRYR